MTIMRYHARDAWKSEYHSEIVNALHVGNHASDIETYGQ